jgi:hypothetical protein
MTLARWCAVLLAAIMCAGTAGASAWGEEARLWRNVTERPEDFDAEMAAIDAMVDPGELTEEARHVRALISRFDSIAHYRALDNLELIVRAIGSGTYPRYPAVDVLVRRWEVDEERRSAFAGWSRALLAWSRGERVPTALPLAGGPTRVDELLGPRTPEKAWLAASLAKTLKAFAFTASDRVAALPEEVFVRAAYRAALGREPSADDLSFRLGELAAGKPRQALLAEIDGSTEARERLLEQVLESAAQGAASR